MAVNGTSEEPKNDHDLLVVVHTKLERVLIDLKEMRDNTVGRIAVLEANKLDKIEAKEMLAAATKHSDEIHADFEARARSLEKTQTQIMTWGTVALLGIGFIEFLMRKYF